jgi:hypothetical protein
VNAHTELLWGVWAQTHQKQAVEDVKIAEEQAELTPEYGAIGTYSYCLALTPSNALF